MYKSEAKRKCQSQAATLRLMSWHEVSKRHRAGVSKEAEDEAVV